MSVLMSTEVAFKEATDRYLTLLGQGSVNSFDPKMVPVIKHLNTLEGVSTVFCCEGHPQEKKDQVAYVMFALQQKGIEKINILYRRLAEVLYNCQNETDAVRFTDIEFKMITRCSQTCRLPYIAHNLTFRLRTEEQKQWFYKKFYEILGIAK